MKKILTFLIAGLFSISVLTPVVKADDGRRLNFSSTTTPGQTSVNKIRINKIEREPGRKTLEVDLRTDVDWKSPKITVKDTKGISYRAYLRDRDDDDFDIYIPGVRFGRSYNIKVSGIKKENTRYYKTLNIKVSVPSYTVSSLKVKDVDYDSDDRELDFEFNKSTLRKSGRYIIVKDAKGNTYSTKNSRLYFDDSDECTLKLTKRLSQGKRYNYTIVGVKAKGSSSYKTITGSFVAWDD